MKISLKKKIQKEEEAVAQYGYLLEISRSAYVSGNCFGVLFGSAFIEINKEAVVFSTTQTAKSKR